MAKESELIQLKINEQKDQYETDLNNLKSNQYSRLASLEEQIRIATFDFETKLLIEKILLQKKIDEAPPEQKETLTIKLYSLIDEQNIKRDNQQAIWERQIRDLKETFRIEQADLEAKHKETLRYLEFRLKEELTKEAEEERKRKEEEERRRKEIAPGLLIERIPYPKWWRDSLNAKIDFTAPGSKVLATVAGKLRLFVSVIVITVTGETAITITFGNAGSSGPIYLGGENQPMGIVIAMGNSPAPCGDGSLSITATDPNTETPLIGGWVTCFAVPYKE